MAWSHKKSLHQVQRMGIETVKVSNLYVAQHKRYQGHLCELWLHHQCRCFGHQTRSRLNESNSIREISHREQHRL